jgi:hypothetical protein
MLFLYQYDFSWSKFWHEKIQSWLLILILTLFLLAALVGRLPWALFLVFLQWLLADLVLVALGAIIILLAMRVNQKHACIIFCVSSLSTP